MQAFAIVAFHLKQCAAQVACVIPDLRAGTPAELDRVEHAKGSHDSTSDAMPADAPNTREATVVQGITRHVKFSTGPQRRNGPAQKRAMSAKVQILTHCKKHRVCAAARKMHSTPPHSLEDDPVAASRCESHAGSHKVDGDLELKCADQPVKRKQEQDRKPAHSAGLESLCLDDSEFESIFQPLEPTKAEQSAGHEVLQAIDGTRSDGAAHDWRPCSWPALPEAAGHRTGWPFSNQ